MRKILHVDMDAFFASVEQMDHPHLRGKPIIVGGKVNQRGVVATCSYEARAFGVRSAMPTSKAIRLCPKAIIIPPNFERYRELSLQIREIFHRYTPLVEPMSIDEAYLDVTENTMNQSSATIIAREIQEVIYKEVGLTCSVGVSFNKFLAKIASGQRKPAGITVIDQESFPEFIKTLPVEKFFGVGQATAKKLHQKKLFTGEDILNCSKEYLIEHFGKQGEALYRQVRGQSNDQLTLYRERKSYGKEETLLEDTTDEEAIKALALSQFDIVIVAIGDNIQANLMTSMLLKEMKMPHVVSKAENALQGKMLKKMGVDMVIYPEYDVAQRLAQSLTREHVMDYLQLSKSISLIEVDMPKFLVGTCLKDSNLREKYNLNAVGIRRGEDLEVPPNPFTILSAEDKLLIIGNNSDLDALTV